MRFQFPAGVCSVGVDGSLFIPDEDGIVEGVDPGCEDELRRHGGVPIADVEDEAPKGKKGKGGKAKAEDVPPTAEQALERALIDAGFSPDKKPSRDEVSTVAEMIGVKFDELTGAVSFAEPAK